MPEVWRAGTKLKELSNCCVSRLLSEEQKANKKRLLELTLQMDTCLYNKVDMLLPQVWWIRKERESASEHMFVLLEGMVSGEIPSVHIWDRRKSALFYKEGDLYWRDFLGSKSVCAALTEKLSEILNCFWAILGQLVSAPFDPSRLLLQT